MIRRSSLLTSASSAGLSLATSRGSWADSLGLSSGFSFFFFFECAANFTFSGSDEGIALKNQGFERVIRRLIRDRSAEGKKRRKCSY